MSENKTQGLFPTKPENNLVSIIVPAYREAGNVKRYQKELIPVLEKLPYDYELIITEDGSTDKDPSDQTWDEMVKFQMANPDKVSILRHSRNYGMTGALQTGIDYAKGDYIILYGADIEIEPEEIKNVIKKMDEGYDIVNTVREGRWKEQKGIQSWVRTFPSKVANSMMRTLGTETKDNGSGLKGYKRFIMDNFKLYGEMQRMMVSYSSVYTKKFIEIPVKYKERTFGESAYGGIKGMFIRTFAVLLDVIGLKFMTSFAYRPFHLKPSRAFGFTGLIIFAIGFFTTIYMILVKIFQGQDIGTRPLFIVGLIFIVLGIQMIMFGMLGELMLRIYFESGTTKNYVVAEKHLAEKTSK